MLNVKPEKSAAILIGTSDFPKDKENFPPIKAVKGNVEDLADLIADQGILGLPSERIHSVVNFENADLKLALRTTARKAQDTLIVYYSGHGVRHDGNLYLTAFNSSRENIDIDGVSFLDFSKFIRESKAKKKVLILDCCYSGKALDLKGTMSGDSEIETQYENARGTYVMASSPSNRPSLFKESKRNTEFTAKFIEVVRQGLPNNRDFLSLDEIFEGIYHDFKSRSEQGETIYLPAKRNFFSSGVENFVKNSLFSAFDDSLRVANERFEAGEYQKAMDAFNRAKAIFSEHPRYRAESHKADFCQHFLSAEAFLQEDRYQDAYQKYSDAAQSVKSSVPIVEARVAESRALYRKDAEKQIDEELERFDYDEALGIYNRLLRDFPKDEDYLTGREYCRQQIKLRMLRRQALRDFEQEKYKDALKRYDEALAIKKDDALEVERRACLKEIEKRERYFWYIANTRKLPELYKIYLDEFPKGKKHAQAEAQLQALSPRPEEGAQDEQAQKIEEMKRELVGERKKSAKLEAKVAALLKEVDEERKRFEESNASLVETQKSLQDQERSGGSQAAEPEPKPEKEPPRPAADPESKSEPEETQAEPAPKAKAATPVVNPIAPMQDREEALWQHAASIDTHKSYLEYLRDSVERRYTLQAREALAKLGNDYGGQDQEAWETACQEDNMGAYSDFFIRFPHSKYTEEAKARYKQKRGSF